MSTESVKDAVKEKYGQAALRAKAGGSSACCGAGAALEPCCDPITSNLYDPGQEGQVPDLALGLARMRQPDGAARGKPRDRPRPRIGRRHRCAALCPPRGPDRESVRPRYDRRNAAIAEENKRRAVSPT
jgi:hypothetical protein